MEKTTFITKSYEGNEWLKSLAQSGIPQINQQVMNPWGLYTESLLTHGIEMPALPFETPVGIFIVLRILKKTKDGYFYGSSYKDAEIAYQAIQNLRNQYVGPLEKEVEGISNLLLPGVLSQKNEAIIEELLIPYLGELKRLNLWDLPSLYHHFIYQTAKLGRNRKGKIILLEEDPLSPLESAFIENIAPENVIEIQSRENLFCHIPWSQEGKKEIFKAYGSYNEWREVLDRILQESVPYDQFLIGSPQEQRIAHFMREQSFVPYTLGCGFEIYDANIETSIKKRREQAVKAGFSGEELSNLENEIRDSLLNDRGNMENSQSGKIHLTKVKSLPLVQRENVFIMGTEAYTGSQIENSILLDGDIIAIKKKLPESDLKTSMEKTRQTIQDFHWTVDLLIRQNRNVTISYSHYDTAQLKINAKPSAISLFEETFIQGEDAGYFSNRRISLSQEEANSRLYYSGKLADTKTAENQEILGVGNFDNLTISATRAETLIQCPYKFVLEKLLGMEIAEDPEDASDITSWLDPRKLGELCHKIIEKYHQQKDINATLEEDKALMKKMNEQVLKDWMIQRPPKVDTEREIKDINALTEKYVLLKNRFGNHKMWAVEHPFEAQEFIPGKLSIVGKADLIEENPEGLAVIDVKTGRQVKQFDQDIKTCIQAVLYCCMLEQEVAPISVSGGHYLYPRSGRSVSCDYGSEVKAKALNLLEEAINSLETGEGWKVDEKEVCGYCSFESICKQEDKGRFFLRLVEEGIIS